jgi:hypothetical protein
MTGSVSSSRSRRERPRYRYRRLRTHVTTPPQDRAGQSGVLERHAVHHLHTRTRPRTTCAVGCSLLHYTALHYPPPLQCTTLPLQRQIDANIALKAKVARTPNPYYNLQLKYTSSTRSKV